MRKVFISTAAIQKLKESKDVSIDYELHGKNYFNPIAYMTKDMVEENDDILVITMMSDGEQPKKNLIQLQDEIKDSLEGKNVTVNFETIVLPTSAFDRDTMHEIFTKLIKYIQEDDYIYADITYGIKPMTMSIIVALNYVNNVFTNVEIEELIYAELYRGETTEKTPESVRNIFDISTLFYLNGIAGKAKPGTKDELDQILNYII